SPRGPAPRPPRPPPRRPSGSPPVPPARRGGPSPRRAGRGGGGGGGGAGRGRRGGGVRRGRGTRRPVLLNDKPPENRGAPVLLVAHGAANLIKPIVGGRGPARDATAPSPARRP